MVERKVGGKGGVASGRRRGLSKGDVREAAILDTALELLLAGHPVSSVTVDQLAKGAGISRSTFYFYFDSVEAVVRALAARAIGDLEPLVPVVSVRPGESVRDQVRTRIAGYLRLWRDHGHVLRAMVPLYESDLELRSFWDSVVAAMNAEVASEIEEERVAGRALPAPPTAKDLVDALSGMLWRAGYELSLTKPSPAADRRKAETLTTVWMRAIFGSDTVD